MIQLFSAFFFFLGFTVSSAANSASPTEPDLVASIYEIGKVGGAPLFTQKRHRIIEPSGVVHDEIIITDVSGTTALRENSTVKEGTLLSLKIEQFQLKETFEIIQSGKKVTFKSFKMEGDKLIPERKDQSEDVSDSFVAGPGLEYFILHHWKELMGDETLHIRFALAERADTVGLKIFKTKVERSGDTETAYLRMKPSSIFIAAIADPVEIIIDAKKLKILKFIGRSPLKKLEGGKFKPLDAEIIYR